MTPVAGPGPDALHGDLDIAADHASFAGHFPGLPILPGVVLLDEALYEIARSRGLDLTHWQIATAKFLGMVRPGEKLVLEHSAPDDATIRFTVRSAAAAVLSGSLAAAAPRDNGI